MCPHYYLRVILFLFCSFYVEKKIVLQTRDHDRSEWLIIYFKNSGDSKTFFILIFLFLFE